MKALTVNRNNEITESVQAIKEKHGISTATGAIYKAVNAYLPLLDDLRFLTQEFQKYQQLKKAMKDVENNRHLIQKLLT